MGKRVRLDARKSTPSQIDSYLCPEISYSKEIIITYITYIKGIYIYTYIFGRILSICLASFMPGSLEVILKTKALHAMLTVIFSLCVQVKYLLTEDPPPPRIYSSIMVRGRGP